MVASIFLLDAVSGTFVENINDPSSRNLILQDISLLLASFDVTGLCHPTSDEHAPIFPKCNTDWIQRTNAPEAQTPRNLEDKVGDDNDGDNENEPNYDDDDDDDNDNYFKDSEQMYVVDTVEEQPDEDELLFNNKWAYTYHASMTIICVLVGATSSGLYVGLVSLDPLLLVIKSRTAKTEKERKKLDRLLALVKQKHQLIVTLLIVNCVAEESMPIFLQHFVHDGVAVISSVVLVLIFGEILPALIFTGSDQLVVACHLVPVVRLLMFLLYPVAYPFAYLLEIISSDGVDTPSACHGGGTVYTRGELAALVRVQYEERRALRQQRKVSQQMNISSLQDIENPDFTSPTSSMDMRNFKRNLQQSLHSIDSHDVTMLEGALQLKTKNALDIFLSYHKAFCIPHDMVLDESNIFSIYASGYSRVPVFVDGDRRKVKGILMTRQLMVVNKNNAGRFPTPTDLSLHTPVCVAPDTNLADLINIFQSNGNTKVRPGHMALVCARPKFGNEALQRGEAIGDNAGLMGIITLEDVLEALLQEQIYDEMDQVKETSSRTYNKFADEMSTIQESSSYHQM
jgi:metal transporter CNNM